MRLPASLEPGAEQLFHPNHVIQLLACECTLRGKAVRIHCGYSVKRAPIGPVFVAERVEEKHGSGSEI
jgi:hypothetical protein